MPETREITVYQFDELSDKAKEKARRWYLQGYPDHDWWDSVYDDALQMADILGIEVDFRYHDLRNGGTAMEPKIWFSGFWSQGDGACWEGSYRYKPGSVKAIAAEAPAGYMVDGVWTENAGNKELNRIAKALQDVQKRFFYKLEASVSHRGHYNHSGCMSVEVTHADDRWRDIGDAEDEITTLLRDFADWIYERLESEHDWLTSDEQVDESIRANEYEFLEDGGLA